jgi:glutamate dehydrogenase (NADP+)
MPSVLVRNGVVCVAEGANMPTTLEASRCSNAQGVLYAPGKASNAGGVATSGLEMSQNAMRISWGAKRSTPRLHGIMTSIHEACLTMAAVPTAPSATSTAPTSPAS